MECGLVFIENRGLGLITATAYLETGLLENQITLTLTTFVCEYSQHQWTDDDCALKKAFICEEGDCSLLQRSFSSVFVLITVHLTCL